MAPWHGIFLGTPVSSQGSGVSVSSQGPSWACSWQVTASAMKVPEPRWTPDPRRKSIQDRAEPTGSSLKVVTPTAQHNWEGASYRKCYLSLNPICSSKETTKHLPMVLAESYQIISLFSDNQVLKVFSVSCLSFLQHFHYSFFVTHSKYGEQNQIWFLATICIILLWLSRVTPPPPANVYHQRDQRELM